MQQTSCGYWELILIAYQWRNYDCGNVIQPIYVEQQRKEWIDFHCSFHCHCLFVTALWRGRFASMQTQTLKRQTSINRLRCLPNNVRFESEYWGKYEEGIDAHNNTPIDISCINRDDKTLRVFSLMNYSNKNKIGNPIRYIKIIKCSI